MNDLPSSATTSRFVEWVDTDAAGHHHNSLILRLAESAERELMTAAGVLHEWFTTAPRVRHEVDYSGKLYFGQQVTSTIVLEKLGRSSATFSFEVWGEQYGDIPRRKAASGKFVVAHVPHGTEKSTPWPDVITKALTPRHPRKGR